MNAAAVDEFDVSSTSDKLLDRLLYKGVLPATRSRRRGDFHVFDLDKSIRTARLRVYAVQSLAMALTQYAPGKRIWVGGKEFVSGALYSVNGANVSTRAETELYFECSICRYALTAELGAAQRGERRDCAACGGKETFGQLGPGCARLASRIQSESIRHGCRRAIHAQLCDPGETDAPASAEDGQ